MSSYIYIYSSNDDTKMNEKKKEQKDNKEIQVVKMVSNNGKCQQLF